jgi:hypothetical protein
LILFVNTFPAGFSGVLDQRERIETSLAPSPPIQAKRRPHPINVPTANLNRIALVPYNAPETPAPQLDIVPPGSPVSLAEISGHDAQQALDSSRLETIVEEVTGFGVTITSALASPSGPRTQAPASSPIQQQCQRKLLIIGTNYDSNARRQTTNCSYAETLSPLYGAFNDTGDLRTAFRKRGYSVHTLGERDFDRVQLLREIGNFLASARAGDVRAIIFTGHSVQLGPDQIPAIVPPICMTEEDAIPAPLLDETIRTCASAGVIVLSIFATCMSGGFMQQSVKLTDFNQAMATHNIRSSNNPIFITFSSSEISESSYESAVLPHDPEIHDHFLWALASTAKNREVTDWGSFVKTLETTFNFARTVGSVWGETEAGKPALQWLLENSQTPYFTVKSQDHVPVRIVYQLY